MDDENKIDAIFQKMKFNENALDVNILNTTIRQNNKDPSARKFSLWLIMCIRQKYNYMRKLVYRLLDVNFYSKHKL